MVGALPLRIFLATPSDVDVERAVVRDCVEQHRVRHNGESRVTYGVVEWDQVRGTARRPQEAIDELIAECHFMIVLFKRAWGSEPGSPWGYTSGTEEEFFTGLLELGQPDQPMRDIWVGFLADELPDPQITALKQQIIKRHAVLFESVTDLEHLRTTIDYRLESWEAMAAHKIPRDIELLPSSGIDVLRAASSRIRGEKLVELGQPEAGRSALEEAAALGGPIERLAHARFLRRHGDLDGAHAEIQKAIVYFTDGGPLYSGLAAEAFSALARVLTDQGHQRDAIGRLRHALTLLIGDDPYTRTVRCRILDDLGHALQKDQDLPAARREFEAALELRRRGGTDLDVCQSLINLARLDVGDGDLEGAADRALEVVRTLRGTPPSGLHANGEVLLAQLRLRQSRPDEGIPHADMALALNRQLGNRRGEAISLLVLAQCCREAGQREEAERHARACLAVNEAMGNRDGADRAQWLLDRLPG